MFALKHECEHTGPHSLMAPSSVHRFHSPFVLGSRSAQTVYNVRLMGEEAEPKFMALTFLIRTVYGTTYTDAGPWRDVAQRHVLHSPLHMDGIPGDDYHHVSSFTQHKP